MIQIINEGGYFWSSDQLKRFQDLYEQKERFQDLYERVRRIVSLAEGTVLVFGDPEVRTEEYYKLFHQIDPNLKIAVEIAQPMNTPEQLAQYFKLWTVSSKYELSGRIAKVPLSQSVIASPVFQHQLDKIVEKMPPYLIGDINLRIWDIILSELYHIQEKLIIRGTESPTNKEREDFIFEVATTIGAQYADVDQISKGVPRAVNLERLKRLEEANFSCSLAKILWP